MLLLHFLAFATPFLGVLPRRARAEPLVMIPQPQPTCDDQTQVQPIEMVFHQPYYVNTYFAAPTVLALGNGPIFNVSNAPATVVTDVVGKQTCVTTVTG